MFDVTELESRLRKAQSKALKAKAAFDAATEEAARLETALSVIQEVMGGSPTQSAGKGTLTRKQHILFSALKFGQNNAQSPIDIYQSIKGDPAFDGDVNYVRTTLWRMADKGMIGSSNGAYWGFEASGSSAEARTPAATKETVSRATASTWDGHPDFATDNQEFAPWDDESEVPF
jgi:hypothetical protein